MVCKLWPMSERIESPHRLLSGTMRNRRKLVG